MTNWLSLRSLLMLLLKFCHPSGTAIFFPQSEGCALETPQREAGRVPQVHVQELLFKDLAVQHALFGVELSIDASAQNESEALEDGHLREERSGPTAGHLERDGVKQDEKSLPC